MNQQDGDLGLLRFAHKAMEMARSPYSKVRVGAIAVGADGQIYPGCNVENASLGLTVCAERTAVASAVAQGVRTFRRIVVATDTEPPASPCGACRQVLHEFAPDLLVIAVGPSSERRWTLAALLPDAFAKQTGPA